jgi:hypothetical protein
MSKKGKRPVGETGREGTAFQKVKRDDFTSSPQCRAAFCGTDAECDHEFFELLIVAVPVPGRKRPVQRIIAECMCCDAVATRVWMNPLDSRFGAELGWLWPELEEAHRAWKRRQQWGRR